LSRHLFLSACAVSLGAAPGELVAREIAVFITGHTLITVRKDTGPRSCCQAALGLAGGKDVSGLGAA
jgi:hypothetical protein